MLAVGTLASLIIGRVAWKDYQLFLSYGPGGPPYNPLGWLVANILRPLRINMIDVRKFETDPDQRSWLGENWSGKAPRPGSRPHTGPHPVPQRQLDQHPSKEIQQVQSLFLLLLLPAHCSQPTLPQPLLVGVEFHFS